MPHCRACAHGCACATATISAGAWARACACVGAGASANDNGARDVALCWGLHSWGPWRRPAGASALGQQLGSKAGEGSPGARPKKGSPGAPQQVSGGGSPPADVTGLALLTGPLPKFIFGSGRPRAGLERVAQTHSCGFLWPKADPEAQQQEQQEQGQAQRAGSWLGFASPGSVKRPGPGLSPGLSVLSWGAA